MQMIKVTKVATIAIVISGIAACLIGAPAKAQQYPQAANGPRIRKDAREKVDYYHAPREIQIIDDRPVVRDFREAPQQEEGIDLPPGPSGNGGGSGGPGGGSMDGGGPSTIPSGGMHLPGNGREPGYRTPPGEGVPLPKSGFGRDTNIPARGMGPRESLPDGTSTNRLMGKMMDPSVVKGVSAGPSKWAFTPQSKPAAAPKAQAPAQTYNNNYAAFGSGSGGSSSRTEGMVRGSLLRH
jgi:hypothetical protein